MVVRNALQIVGSLVFMFALNAALTGVLLSVIPIVSLGAVQYGQCLYLYAVYGLGLEDMTGLVPVRYARLIKNKK